MAGGGVRVEGELDGVLGAEVIVVEAGGAFGNWEFAGEEVVGPLAQPGDRGREGRLRGAPAQPRQLL